LVTLIFAMEIGPFGTARFGTKGDGQQPWL